MGICYLEYGIESLQYVPVTVLQFIVHIQHIQYRLVILVDEYHSSVARLFMG